MLDEEKRVFAEYIKEHLEKGEYSEVEGKIGRLTREELKGAIYFKMRVIFDKMKERDILPTPANVVVGDDPREPLVFGNLGAEMLKNLMSMFEAILQPEVWNSVSPNEVKDLDKVGITVREYMKNGRFFVIDNQGIYGSHKCDDTHFSIGFTIVIHIANGNYYVIQGIFSMITNEVLCAIEYEVDDICDELKYGEPLALYR
jgi:hypothetical protein